MRCRVPSKGNSRDKVTGVRHFGGLRSGNKVVLYLFPLEEERKLRWKQALWNTMKLFFGFTIEVVQKQDIFYIFIHVWCKCVLDLFYC